MQLEAVHCLKLAAVHWLWWRMQCETVTSEVFHCISSTILLLQLVVQQKALDQNDTTCLHVLVVRKDFTSNVCALVLQRHALLRVLSASGCYGKLVNPNSANCQWPADG